MIQMSGTSIGGLLSTGPAGELNSFDRFIVSRNSTK